MSLRSAALTALSSVATTLFLGGPANAGDAVCLWDAIPDSYRGAFLAAYPDEGQRALVRLNPPADVLGPIMTSCGVQSREQVATAVKALMAHSIGNASAQMLNDRFGITRSSIDAAWDRLSATSRDVFSKSVLAGADAGMPASSPDPRLREAALAVVKQVASLTEAKDPEAVRQLGIYLTWKVAKPRYESNF
jgi:hypothetical protein